MGSKHRLRQVDRDTLKSASRRRARARDRRFLTRLLKGEADPDDLVWIRPRDLTDPWAHD